MFQVLGSSYWELGRRTASPSGLPKLMVSMLPGGMLLLEALGLAGKAVKSLNGGFDHLSVPTQLPYFETLDGAFVLYDQPPGEVMKWRVDAVTANTKVTFDPRAPHMCIVLARINRAEARQLERQGHTMVPLVADKEDRPIPQLVARRRQKSRDPRLRQQARVRRALEAVDLEDQSFVLAKNQLEDRMPAYC